MVAIAYNIHYHILDDIDNGDVNDDYDDIFNFK